ncbi:hypothetical protein DSM101010T_11020 [Desulfovibrio subterraneus]|uniref:Uncharacterized protein n=1 Tax=Desulfovibrio subterraneus TaxID=2718620 RepID=A0A7J0BG79_9BACT|nr:hypothetical protein [Desulfovibrio subterraneus]GFM32737.1 hypothetical protein DSM101010T_11020 [Desulfovibrio subterraneus]
MLAAATVIVTMGVIVTVCGIMRVRVFTVMVVSGCMRIVSGGGLSMVVVPASAVVRMRVFFVVMIGMAVRIIVLAAALVVVFMVMPIVRMMVMLVLVTVVMIMVMMMQQIGPDDQNDAKQHQHSGGNQIRNMFDLGRQTHGNRTQGQADGKAGQRCADDEGRCQGKYPLAVPFSIHEGGENQP